MLLSLCRFIFNEPATTEIYTYGHTRALHDALPTSRRKLGILKQGIVLPAPSTPGAAAELNTIATRLQSTYGKGKGTLDGKPISGNDIEEKMGTVRDPAKLKEMWVSWHKVEIGRAHV